MLHHLTGTTRQSSFRRTLGSILRQQAGLQPLGKPGHYGFRFTDEGEAWLTAYLRRNCLVMFAELTDPRAAEQWLIRQVRPPLNIKFLEGEPFAQRLLDLRWRTSLDALEGPR